MRAIAKPSDTRRREVSIRRFISERVLRRVALVALAVVVVVNADELYRRVCFWSTGTVQVHGLTFYLNAADECLTYYILEDGTWEPEETRLVLERLRPGDTVIDVGANIGWYTVLASRVVGEDGLVIAFEPDPTNFALLQRNIEANDCRNVRLEQRALSNEPGSITLFLHERNQGMHSVLRSDETKHSVEIEAVRLDDYLRDVSRHIDFVKIDVEGAEGMVLEGMHATLKSNPHMNILLEFAPHRLTATGYDPESVLRGLAAGGFNVYEVGDPGDQLRTAVASDLLRKLSLERRPYANLLVCGSQITQESR